MNIFVLSECPIEAAQMQCDKHVVKMIVETESYNEKRYGRPYIAQCDELGKVVKWGEWIGSDGYEGELHIDLSHDCIVMMGQKDNRGNNSSPKFATFINGTLSGWTQTR